MTRLRRHLTYSNVVSSLCLFLLLGGGAAWAVDGPLAGQNTVGSADIINNEVQSADIKDANLTTADIRVGAVTSGKVLDNSLTDADIDESSLGIVPNQVLSNRVTVPAEPGGVVSGNVIGNGEFNLQYRCDNQYPGETTARLTLFGGNDFEEIGVIGENGVTESHNDDNGISVAFGNTLPGTDDARHSFGSFFGHSQTVMLNGQASVSTTSGFCHFSASAISG